MPSSIAVGYLSCLKGTISTTSSPRIRARNAPQCDPDVRQTPFKISSFAFTSVVTNRLGPITLVALTESKPFKKERLLIDIAISS